MTRRVKRVSISDASIAYFFITGRKVSVVAHGLPEDHVVERVFHDPATMTLNLVVSHHSFDEVKDGALIPEAENATFEMVLLEEGEIKPEHKRINFREFL